MNGNNLEISKKQNKIEPQKKGKSKLKTRIKKAILIPSIIGIFVSLLFLNHIGPWLNTPFSKAPYLSWTGDSRTSMTVTWETPLPCDTVLLYGINSSYGNMFYDPTPTFLHTANLTGLEPGTIYHYKVYSNSFFMPYFLFDKTFKTAPNDIQPFSFAIYGDNRPDVFGITAHQTIVNQILALNPDFVINVGDIVMTSNRLDQYDRFFYEIQYLAGTRPYMISVGNHEIYEYGGNVLPYLYYVNYPGNKIWYSFNYSNAYFISLCIYEDNQILTSNQLEFLENELKIANSSKNIDWIFVYFHAPLIDSAGARLYSEVQLMPILNKYKVDFVISGHDHFYERLYIPNFHHIIAGGGGAELEILISKTPFTIASKIAPCFSLFEIQNRTVFYQCIDTQGNIIDWLTVTK